MKPEYLDIVKRDADYVLYYCGKPYKTPQGIECCCVDARPLEHIMREMSLAPTQSTTSEYATFLIAGEYARLRDPDGTIRKTIPEFLENDPLLKRRQATGKRKPGADFLNWLESNAALSFFLHGITRASTLLNELLIEQSQGQITFINTQPTDVLQALTAIIADFSHQQLAVLYTLCARHGCGLVLPTLLLLNRCTPSEYANAIFSLFLPGNTSALSPKIAQKNPFADFVSHSKPNWDNPTESFRAIQLTALKAQEIARIGLNQAVPERSLAAIIREGENFRAEFKSTLRWNIKAGKKDTAIEHASLKTINAFLNSTGGTLLIGVRDDGSIEGLETDQFQNEDRYALHFWNLIKSSMGQDVTPFVQADFHSIEDKRVLAVHCSAGTRPVFLNQKGFGEEFYIRVGPSSASLSIQEALKYIAGRFRQDA